MKLFFIFAAIWIGFLTVTKGPVGFIAGVGTSAVVMVFWFAAWVVLTS